MLRPLWDAVRQKVGGSREFAARFFVTDGPDADSETDERGERVAALLAELDGVVGSADFAEALDHAYCAMFGVLERALEPYFMAAGGSPRPLAVAKVVACMAKPVEHMFEKNGSAFDEAVANDGTVETLCAIVYNSS